MKIFRSVWAAIIPDIAMRAGAAAAATRLCAIDAGKACKRAGLR